jgi:hypothetical protein
MVDALASGGDEGRGRLRKASDRCEQPLIRRFPNGETHPEEIQDIPSQDGKPTKGSETSQYLEEKIFRE